MSKLQHDTREIATALIGTADNIQACIARLGLEHLYDNETDLDTNVFDSIVFECQSCNWWCSMDECNDSADGQWICDDCRSDE